MRILARGVYAYADKSIHRLMGVTLPYGRTRITASEYRQLIDVPKVVEHLRASGVNSPEKRTSGLIQRVPYLLYWLEQEGRDFPWRYTTEPWRVYATEILLQRTRAGAVEEVYESFFTRFPTPQAVVKVDDTVIFEEIKSLGFGDQRTRSIREAAEYIVKEHNGEVPPDLDELRHPWRVGEYSARACLLFAFKRPLALVDVNTARIISRVFGYEMPAQPHKSELVYEFFDALVPSDPAVARAYNLAQLDLGALTCTEDNPACPDCPLERDCEFAVIDPVE